MKKIEVLGVIQLTREQMKLLKPTMAKIEASNVEGKKPGSVAAQIFFDGSMRVVYLTPRQVTEWQKFIGNVGHMRVTAGGSAFK